ncbi:bestrophin family protein [Flavihumibacter sp. ZG627]|uniref:bestrophin family protein n=1 Tax=Flavihumibacter sp. ZG627 TaxID=1463156 RepID=UPI00057F7D3B|nr:bestrophin family ion channel [Flavihumibacter sp. ZG627]KIC89361.1 membrane protein [Flavihumibacter sp. ZG627]
MISYNTKDWLSVLFNFHKADTFRKLFPMMIVISLYSWGVAYIEVEILKLSQNSTVKNVSIMHNLLGFAISMLLVFRTNTAYDRWWEGRKLWGSLTNNSRNLAVKLNAILGVDDNINRNFFRKSIPLYASMLRDHLRSEKTRLALDEIDHPELEIDQSRHLPNQVASLMLKRTHDLYRNKQISGDQLITLNNELASFTDICGACERIKNTPIPYSYSVFIKKFIFIYVITLPIGFVFNLGYLVIPVVVFVFYVLASLELIAEEIEDPFGGDANDVPTEKLSQNIKLHVNEIFS